MYQYENSFVENAPHADAAAESLHLAIEAYQVVAAVASPIQIYRRGHPLAADLRSRVMLYVQQGLTAKAVAESLLISVRTVSRYKNLALTQNLSVPLVQPRGGFRKSIALLNRQQILALGELLLKNPKLTIRELKQLAAQQEIIDSNKVPSDTSIWRAIKKLNIDWKKASYSDPKGVLRRAASERDGVAELDAMPADIMDPGAKAIMEERAAFRYIQRQGFDGQLNPYKLWFMDESNFRMFDQQHHAWTLSNRRAMLLRPKGMSPTFNVIATIGIEDATPGGAFIHYVVIPPRRDFRGVPKTFKSYEFKHPKAGIDLGYSGSQIRNDLSMSRLKELMAEQRLRLPVGIPDAAALEREIRDILVQVRTSGKVGLYRVLPERQAYLGGIIKAFRSTALDVVDYVEHLLLPWYVKRKLHGFETECNEDSDGIVGCPDSGRHFSVPFMEPMHVTRRLLVNAEQIKRRQLQRASHHLSVYQRSKKGQTEAGQVLLTRLTKQTRDKEQKHQEAENALREYEASFDSGVPVPLQDEISGVGYKNKLGQKTLIWDGASTHGAIRITSARKKSFWHSYADKIGLAGVIFLPPRTPTLNPIELMFGFIKHHIRKNCPDTGYTADGLVKAIHDAFRLVRPEMIRGWIKKAGYRFPADKPEQRNNVDPNVSKNPSHDDGGVAPMQIDSDADELEIKRDDNGDEEKQALPAEANGVVSYIHDGAAANCVVELSALPELVPLDQSGVAANNDNVCHSLPRKRFSRKSSFICMDENGSVRRKKRRGSTQFDPKLDLQLPAIPVLRRHLEMQNVLPQIQQIHAFDTVPPMHLTSDANAFASVAETRRWAGLGPQPAGLKEQTPHSVARNQDDGNLWEIDGIVEHQSGPRGTYTYLVRYKGYTEADDEWLDEAALETAPGSIKEYWSRVKVST